MCPNFKEVWWTAPREPVQQMASKKKKHRLSLVTVSPPFSPSLLVYMPNEHGQLAGQVYNSHSESVSISLWCLLNHPKKTLLLGSHAWPKLPPLEWQTVEQHSWWNCLVKKCNDNFSTLNYCTQRMGFAEPQALPRSFLFLLLMKPFALWVWAVQVPRSKQDPCF